MIIGLQSAVHSSQDYHAMITPLKQVQKPPTMLFIKACRMTVSYRLVIAEQLTVKSCAALLQRSVVMP